MRSVRLTEAVPPSVAPDLTPQPSPGRGELLIRVCAAGVTTGELTWYPTSHRKNGEARTRAVPSHEFSGVVVAAGEDVGSLEIGRQVFGMNDWYADGAMADYCVAPFFAVAPKPRRLTHYESAAVPISALTAWQGLFDRAELKAGETLLVQGGAGAVGIFVIQLAHRHGARVIATASGKNRDFVLNLGADEVIDYQKQRFEDRVKDVDVVFDTVGGETLERSWRVLKPQGRLVTVASTSEDANDPRVKQAFFIVEPNQKQLFEIADLLDAGTLRPVLDCVIPISKAAGVFAGTAPRKGRGKLVIALRNMDRDERKQNGSDINSKAAKK